MVCYKHEVACLEACVHSARCVCKEEHLCAQHSHKSCRKHNVLHCIALIIMHSALHYNNRHFANISENELTLMTLYR